MDQTQQHLQQPTQSAQLHESYTANAEVHASDPPGQMNSSTLNVSHTGAQHIEPKTIDDDSKASPRLQLSSWQWKILYPTIFLTTLMLGYDSSNSANIQIPVYEAFGHIDLLPWVIASYSLGNFASVPLVRRLMEVMNPRWFLVTFWLITLVAGVLAGAASNMQMVVVGRILMGIGIAGVYVCVLTNLRLLTSHVEFARINGLMGMGLALGLICGPVISGAFAENEHTTWRWAFYVTVPWVAMLIALSLCWFPSIKPAKKGPFLQTLVDIDWVGMVLHAATMVLFITALLDSGTSWAWNSGSTIATWIVFGCVLAAYILQQTFCWFTTADNRIFPVSIVKLRVGAFATIGTFCSGASYGVPLYYLPLFYAFTRGDGPIQTAVHLIPYLCVFVAFSLISGILLPRVRYAAALYLVGGILITAGTGALMAVNEQSPLSMVMGISTLVGAGVGLTFQLGIATLGVALPPSSRVDSFVAMNLAQYGGITVGVSAAGCIYQNEGFRELQAALGGLGFSDLDIRNAMGGLRSPILEGGDAEVTGLAISVLSRVIIKLFYLVVPMGILMVLCACMMKWEALSFEPQNKAGEESAEEVVTS